MKILIIGAGVAGLSAGAYGQINGFETEIYEMHTISGGECTGWSRSGYNFDGCIHWLVGSKSGTTLNRMWRETGALSDDIAIIRSDYYTAYEANGQTVYLYSDPDKLQKHLLEVSPVDAEAIRELCEGIRKMRGFAMDMSKPMEQMGLGDMMKVMRTMRPYMKTFRAYSKMTLEELSQRFVNPAIRGAIRTTMSGGTNSAYILLGTLSGMASGDSGWPTGGSKALTQRMEARYRELGGKVHYRARILRIVEENGCAIGLELSDGSIVRGDYVVSTADGYETLYRLLGGKHISEKQRRLYDDAKKYEVVTSVTVSIGVDCDLSERPHSILVEQTGGLDVGGHIAHALPLRHYCQDKTLNTAGKSVVNSVLLADYGWWKEKHKDKEAYRREKERIGKAVAALLEERYPETKGKIEVIDVATPITYERYCNAWKGSWMSWMMTPKNDVQFLNGKVPGLKKFEQAGQWTLPPGGLPTAVSTGSWAIQRICKAEKIKYKTA